MLTSAARLSRLSRTPSPRLSRPARRYCEQPAGGRLAALRQTLAREDSAYAQASAEPSAEPSTDAEHGIDVPQLCVAMRGYFKDARYFGAVDSAPGESAPLPTLTQLAATHPTYVLNFDPAHPELRKLVLRTRRRGEAEREAEGHGLNREFRLTQLLHARRSELRVPVPAPHVFISDASFLGAPFYLCDHVEGRSFADSAFAAAEHPRLRRALCDAVVDVAVAVHSVDVDAAGLRGLAAEGSSSADAAACARRYRAVETERRAEVEWLMEWLAAARPPASGVPPSLLHGDMRVDNFVFDADPTSGRPPAVKAL